MASVAVLVGGILMKYYEIYWVDSVLTFIIALYLVIMGWNLLKNSTGVLMLFTPEDIQIDDIVKDIQEIDVIKNMHHVHVWQLNENEIHLEAHIDFTEDITLSKFNKILYQIEKKLYHINRINHINIQPEYGKCDKKTVIVQD